MIVLLLAGAAAALEVGQAAPDFSLPATTGGKISLGEFRGKQAVLIDRKVARRLGIDVSR